MVVYCECREGDCGHKWTVEGGVEDHKKVFCPKCKSKDFRLSPYKPKKKPEKIVTERYLQTC